MVGGISRWYGRVIESAFEANLGRFVRDSIDTNVLVKTDCWSDYKGMEKESSNPERSKSGKKGENFKPMPRVVMMFKAWLGGTHDSVMSLQPYIKEYTYRFNRHKMKERIFENLVLRMVAQPPYSCKEFIYQMPN